MSEREKAAIGSRLRAFLRGDYYWRHERWWEYRLARIICAVWGHTPNVYEGGDCMRCWGPSWDDYEGVS